ncbi:glycosyltransferase family 2 protein [Arthrobacter sp. 2MCAF14]|uniref:glycosyltransferase family 2 protein n=1 Tax=Arthrobacter sp. 2MCAF14 TaxID=3232982 RepID=UPI003F8F4838
MERINVIATVFNRVETSLRAFRSLEAQSDLGSDFELRYFVVDDKSSDGTRLALESEFRERMTVRSGTGDLFWSGGMAAAQRFAINSDPDWLLWLNDDVELDPDAISRLLSVARKQSRASIVVGAMMSRSSSTTTYSGMLKTAPWPGGLTMVEPTDSPQIIDAFHGNFVLVPREIYNLLGTIDDRFAHAYGDIDYGLRTKRAGYVSILAPNHFGFCESNPKDGSWMDAELSFVGRVKLLFSRKGYPFRSHVLFNRKHGGLLWPVFLAASYLKAFSKILKSK